MKTYFTQTTKAIFLLVFLAVVWQVQSDVPEQFNFQLAVRDAQGNVYASQQVNFRVGIMQGSTVLYQESHAVQTNAYGLVNIMIGDGVILQGSMATIDWGGEAKSLMVEFDPSGGVNYIHLSTTPLLSVPYALYARHSEEPGPEGPMGPQGEPGPQGEQGPVGPMPSVGGADTQVQFNNTGVFGGSDNFVFNPSTNRVGIGTSAPLALLHTNGTGLGQGNIIFVGERKTVPGSLPISGPGTRMMWYPDKGAFRAGHIEGQQWDTDSIGFYSVAAGYSTAAPGAGSFSMGFNTRALGVTSAALGLGIIASSAVSTAIGRYNVGGGNIDTWIGTDPVFEIGIGTSATDRRNAITILKNGNTGIGTLPNANALLHTHGTSTGEGNVLFSGSFKENNPGNPPESEAGTRMMWYPDKAAFRVGYVNSTNWNKDSIGNYSFATGNDTKAKGNYSIAMGFKAKASGDNSTAIGTVTSASGGFSTALGYYATASGVYSTSIGYMTTASEYASTAFGAVTTASGDNSTAMGYNTTASGIYSMVMGHSTTASEGYSTAMGYKTTASGYSSTAMGYNTTASGTTSTAMGVSTTAPSYAETVIGRYNTTYTPISATEWNMADRLFVIGNGTGNATRSNAFTVLKNGNTGISTDVPRQQLSVGNYLDLYSGFLNSPTCPSIRASSNNNLIINAYDTGILYFNLDGGTGETRFYAGAGGAELLRINPDGRVGIGTGAPTQKLHVVGDAYKTLGGTAWAISSDLKLKTLLGEYEKGLDEIAALQAVRFRYLENNPRELSSDIEQVGFVAQEVMKIFPEAVSEAEDGYLDFNIHAINVAMVNAIKELKAENDRLQQENHDMNARLERLEKALESLSEK